LRPGGRFEFAAWENLGDFEDLLEFADCDGRFRDQTAPATARRFQKTVAVKPLQETSYGKQTEAVRSPTSQVAAVE